MNYRQDLGELMGFSLTAPSIIFSPKSNFSVNSTGRRSSQDFSIISIVNEDSWSSRSQLVFYRTRIHSEGVSGPAGSTCHKH